MLLKDKIVMVSGIGPGLGVKLAVEAARAGAAGLIIGARSADKLDDAEQRVREVNPGCTVVKHKTDITNRDDCAAFADAGVKKFGRIDGLVNSAFLHGDMDHVMDAKLDDWITGPLATNLIGTLKLTQAVVPQMKKQGGGAIVMINTMATRRIPPLGEAGYAASKAALANSVKFLAKEVGPDKIRVNTVYMGWMWGAPVKGYFEWAASQPGAKATVEQMRAGIASEIPLREIPPDDDCARAALFFLSDYSRVVTGASLDINGGHFMP
jgi:NAD(P)-dependent dehydrogenase (short-subunit alcohol dehydrogenase family)